MTPEQYKDLVEKVGTESADKIKSEMKDAETRLDQKFADKLKGNMTQAEFESFKTETLEPINEKLAKIETLENALKEQGNKMKSVLERGTPNSKSIEQFIIEKAEMIKDLKSSGKMMEISASELKAAGVQSISGTIQPMDAAPNSPYAPGIGGGTLEIFDIARNPNYITNHVDMGRTDQSRLAWANETTYEGAPAEVEEGEEKPQVQHKFKVETSTAKKIAGWLKITDEFDQDLPQFATKVRRMLQDDVVRGFDDAIQAAVIGVATPFNLADLNGTIDSANYWDSLLSMMAQVGYNNFDVNTIGINNITNVLLKTAKNDNGSYLLPSFADEINRMLVRANKVDVNKALVGDLKQFKVDVYKEFYLKLGWVNDDLIKNQFTIVGEIRYHRYISDARKKAIVYDGLNTVQNLIKAA